MHSYKNELPAGRLIPIVTSYPNEIVILDLLGPYPASRIKRYRYILVITDHFSKWLESVLSVRNNNVVIWKANRRTTVNIDQVRIYYQRKSDEGVIEVESSVSRGSEYQSSSLEENRPILDQSKGLRSSESGERRGEQGKNTSLTGNQGGDEALTINIDSPNNRVANSQSKVKGAEDPVLIFLDTPNNKVANSRSKVKGAEDPVLIYLDRVDNTDNKIARSLKIVQRLEGQNRFKSILDMSRKEGALASKLLQTEDYDLPSAMEFLKNRKDFFKDLRLGTALNEMLCDTREFADEIDIPANFELTQPRH
ncbi:uncharacterized protein TNCV_1994721 [Trichonephila clavipes]|nr:uncharacterized protein TNCV_1994721 [Trichonephila clavipes]